MRFAYADPPYHGFARYYKGRGHTTPGYAAEVALSTEGNQTIIFDPTQITCPDNYSNPQPGDPSPPIMHHGSAPMVWLPGQLRIRRLMPIEGLRLQGFPDTWLDDLSLSDSAKWRMIGNAVSVNVSAWIGRRLDWVSQHERKVTIPVPSVRRQPIDPSTLGRSVLQ